MKSSLPPLPAPKPKTPSSKTQLALSALVLCIGAIAVTSIYYLLIVPSLRSAYNDKVKAVMEERVSTMNGLAQERVRLALALAGIGENLHRTRKSIEPKRTENEWESVFKTELASQLKSFQGVVGAGIWYEPYAFSPVIKHRGYYMQWVPPVGKERTLEFTMDWSDPAQDYHSQKWYRSLIPEQPPRSQPLNSNVTWTAPYKDPVTGVLMTTVDAAMYAEDGHLIGMSTVDWNLDQIQAIVQKTRPTRHSATYLIEPISKLIVATTESGVGALSPMSKLPVTMHLLESIEGAKHTVMEEAHVHEESQIESFPLSNGMVLGFVVPAADILAPASAGLLAILISLVAVLIVSTLAIYIVSGQFIEAITRQLKIARDAAVDSATIKDQFLANVSHEIRTPMNGVLGMLDLVLDQKLPSETHEMVSLAYQSAKGLIRIINDLLDISKLQSGMMTFKNEAYSPTLVVRSITEMLKTLTDERKLEVVNHTGSTVPNSVIGDSGRIAQVLTNLVGNGIKFNNPLGGLLILVDLDPQKPDTLLYCVSDTGGGIPQDKLDYIFETFTQLDGSSTRAAGGSGLGLAITKSLVEAMGGTIEVRSKEGIGSAFIVRLPLVIPQKKVTNDRPDALRPSQVLMTPLKILVAEDNLVNQKLIQKVLTQAGHSVTLAENGAVAVSAFSKEEFNLVILDIQMPVLDGVEALKRIRSEEIRGSTMPILACTAHALPDQVRDLMNLGFNGCVVKPINRAELFSEIMRLTRQDDSRR